MPAINRPETVAKLRLWDKVMPIYKEKFKRSNTDAFTGIIKSLSSMAKWPEMVDLMKTFTKLNLSGQSMWDKLDLALQSSLDDSLRRAALQAISALHQKKYDKIVNDAFSLLASRPINLWADNQQIHIETMLVTQQLVEILEMKDWILNEKHQTSIEEVLNERLSIAPRDFELCMKLFGNRAAITSNHDENYIDFFQLRSLTMATKIHMNAFNALFPDFDFNTSQDPLAMVCYAVTHWSIGLRKQAI